MWYLSKVVNEVLEHSSETSEWHVSESAPWITCVHVAVLQQRRDAEIERIQSGQIPYMALPTFWKEFTGLYRSLIDAEEHLSAITGLTVNGSTVISDNWLSNYKDDCIHELEREHSINLPVSFRSS